MLHTRKFREYLSALSHMIEKAFQMDDPLHLSGLEYCQYLLYLHVFASLVPRTIHSLLFSELMFNFKPSTGMAGLRLDTLLSDTHTHV